MEIQVEGLSPIQRELADRIWECDSEQDVAEFIASLPTKRLRAQAGIVKEMMTWAVWDDVVKEQQEFPQVMELLDNIRG